MRLRHRRGLFLLSGLLVLLFLLVLGWRSRTVYAGPGALFVAPTGTGTVCSPSAPCALSTALAQAVDGDVLYLAQGVYTGTGAAVLTLTKAITLYGGWDGAPTGTPRRNPRIYPSVLDGQGVRRGVFITATRVVLDGLTIVHGSAVGLGGYSSYDAGGGIYAVRSTVWIRNSVVLSNTAGNGGVGGGIFLLSSYGEIEGNRVLSNTAIWGGGIRVISGAPRIRGNLIAFNRASFGGGFYLMWSQGLVEENQVLDNQATKNGGGFYLSGDRSTIRANVVQGNGAGYGGGIALTSGAVGVVVSANRILSNTAVFEGGGLRVTYNDAWIENNVLAGNAAAKGAGIYLGGARPKLFHNTLARNAGGTGIGIWVDGGSWAALTNTLLVSHVVGISVTVGSTATLEGTLWGSGVWSNGTDWGGAGTILTGTHNVWGWPDFRDPDRGDYHVGAASAARDVGVPSPVTRDLDGEPRPVGSAPDLGADEFAWPVYLPLTLREP